MTVVLVENVKVEITAQHSPLQSLNFAALKIKDAIADAQDKNAEWLAAA